MANPNVAALAAYPGEYRQELISEVYSSLRLEQEGILLIPGVKNKLNLHKLLVADGTKPYTGTFVSKDGDITFVPRVLEVEKAQRDIEIEPEKYRATFMAKMRGNGEGASNQTIPYAEFMWKQYMNRVGTEVNLQTVYHGVGKAAFAAYNAGTVYAVGDLITYTQGGELRYFRCVTITTAGQNPDTHAAKWAWAGARAIVKGFGKIIADEITGGGLTVVATGAVSSSNAYAKFTQMFRSLPEPVQLGLVGQAIVFCSLTDYQCLVDDYEEKVTKNFETIDGITYLAKTDRKCRIWPVSWLSGSRRLIATVADNLVAGTDELSDMNDISTIPTHYKIQTALSFVIGFQIQDLEVLRVSDQA
jgi:hypothetical protein